jgi:hypothetical protein
MSAQASAAIIIIDMPFPPAAELFIEHLCQAAARIAWQYFQLPVFGKEDPILRERVYCYELYHQLRILLKEDGALAGYLLSGETDKQGHRVIRQCAPDFVFHEPGRMENLAVVEVKPISADIAGVRKDRETLEYFLSPEVGYQAGIELVYGDGEKAVAAFQDVFADVDPERFRLLWHRQPRERATVIR